jgi:ribonuclease HI
MIFGDTWIVTEDQKSRIPSINGSALIICVGHICVDIAVKCSSNPLKLENNTDLARLIAFLGRLRDRLIVLLADKEERIVPDLTEWYLTELRHQQRHRG